MHRLLDRHVAAAAVALTVVAAACGGDNVLAPADGTACTVGSIAAGDTVTGEIRTDGCLLWNDYEYLELASESWTLRTAKDKVYIIRVKPIAVNGGTNTLDARLWVSGRNEAGDPVLLGAQNGSFTNPDPGGASAIEMVLPSRVAQTLSVRVAADDVGDNGGYELTVQECTLRKVELSLTSAAVNFDDGCSMYTFGGLAPSPVAFFSFDALVDSSYTVTGTRTDGTANFRMSLRGPGLDFGCYFDDCQNVLGTSATGAGPYSLVRTAPQTADYTVVIAQASAGTLTTTLDVSKNPVLLMAPFTAQR